MIVSAIDGRIRVRDRSLRNTAKREALATRLVRDGRFRRIESGAAAGSLLVRYDPQTITLDEAKRAVAAVCGSRGGATAATRQSATAWTGYRPLVGRGAKLGMLSSLGISGYAAFFGPKALHKASGKVFFLFAGLHMLLYRERLLK